MAAGIHGERDLALGAKIQDQLTGYIGVATMYSVSITGSEHYLIEAHAELPGRSIEQQWFDAHRLSYAAGCPGS